MANEWEALGGCYSNDNWKLSVFVGFERADIYRTGAAPFTIGFGSGDANDVNTPFSGFSFAGSVSTQANILRGPIGQGPDPTLVNGSISPAIWASLPGVAPGASVVPLTDAGIANNGITGILASQLTAGGPNKEIFGAPENAISNHGNLVDFSKPRPSADPTFAPDSVSFADLVPADEATGPSGSSLNGPGEATPFQTAIGFDSLSSAPASISMLDLTASNTGSNAPSGASSVTFDVSVAGSGLVFDNTITSGFTMAFETDIIDAEDILAEHWANSITLNLDFSAANKGADSDLSSNSWPSFVAVSYATLKSALAAHDQSSVYAENAVAALPASDPNPAGGDDWNLPEAYARMLGLSASTPSVDDTVTLNTYYLSDSIVSQDVIDAMTHEISEGGMGRVGGLGDQNGVWSTMDLFRYNSSGMPDYSDGRNGDGTYFSYNGGQTPSLAAGLSFNNEYNSQDVKVNGGDTADFTQLDVFGVGEVGETFGLSQTDIEVMDVLGWTPMPPASVPAPVPTPPGTSPPPSTPAGTTCDMVLQDTSGGNLELYDLGGNSVLAAYPMGNVGLDWQTLGFGDFAGNPDEADMLMHDSNTGNLEYDDIRASQTVSAGPMGNIGLAWQVLGLGDFSGNANETDMIMRDTNNGNLQYFDIQDNEIVSAGPAGNIGLIWQLLGVGDFSGNPNESDLLIRDANTGNLQYLDIQNNQVVGAGPAGNIGLNWQLLGVGDFSGNPNESDLLIRDTNTGNLQYLDIQDNQVVAAGSMGNIGVNWQVAGFADISGNPNESDMIMRDNSTGSLEYLDIQRNEVVNAGSLGNVGLAWQTLGVAGPLMLDSQLI